MIMEVSSLEMFESTVKYTDELIFIMPVCDFFGINYQNQCRAISKDPILKEESSKRADPNIFGDNHERFALSKKGFMRWIQRLNSQTVKKELYDRLIEYQRLVSDFLFGSAEKDNSFRETYSKLQDLKRQKVKITAEIKTCKKNIDYYLKYRYQGKLFFGETKMIEN